ncbi:uncharacterized protein LOC117781289 [Drosophila innubila]|uniref:uncharacterized protein LOC117781289 n=1 Tax=Drosophila innubila TaxID=198719 RepID=UPI00148C1012|nr:uncharacterized protein LOC117781289 [Drosophila innubila]
MRRLLLIQITLWSFVSAIPQEDLSLIKQVELLCENTYKLIMQNKLEFCTYAAKEVVDCKAANETELEKWQHWLDLSNAERFNITENEILNYKVLTDVQRVLLEINMITADGSSR